MTVAVNDPVRVVADIPGEQSVSVERGTTVQFSFPALPDVPPVTSKVTRTSDDLAVNVRTLRAEVDVPNPDGKIKPGMFATEEFVVAVHKGVLSVPPASVLMESQNAAVFTVESGRAKRISVQVGFKDHGWTEVSSPSLTEGTVVIQDAHAVRDGFAVQSAK